MAEMERAFVERLGALLRGHPLMLDQRQRFEDAYAALGVGEREKVDPFFRQFERVEEIINREETEMGPGQGCDCSKAELGPQPVRESNLLERVEHLERRCNAQSDAIRWLISQNSQVRDFVGLLGAEKPEFEI